MRKWVLAGGAVVALMLPASAVAQDNNNWGQVVKSCVGNSACYDGGTRGSYVSQQARDNQGPGYGYEIQTLANPGGANPAPFGGPGY